MNCPTCDESIAYIGETDGIIGSRCPTCSFTIGKDIEDVNTTVSSATFEFICPNCYSNVAAWYWKKYQETKDGPYKLLTSFMCLNCDFDVDNVIYLDAKGRKKLDRL